MEIIIVKAQSSEKFDDIPEHCKKVAALMKQNFLDE